MSREPQTPNTDKGVAGNSILQDRAAGRRFTANPTILETEAELAIEGVELPNRAIPMEYHTMNRDYTPAEITELIETEVAKDAPNQSLIGYLNQLKND